MLTSHIFHFRREVLKAIGADLKDELQYSREMIEDHPKNYQVILRLRIELKHFEM